MEKSPVTTTLGTHLKRRRRELKIGQAEAARAADAARSTWITWEDDKFVPSDKKWAAIEAAMRWEPGSVADILDGGQPTPQSAEVVPLPAAGLPPDDEFVHELRKLVRSEEHLRVLIKEYWDEKEREEERIQEKFRRIARAAGG